MAGYNMRHSRRSPQRVRPRQTNTRQCWRRNRSITDRARHKEIETQSQLGLTGRGGVFRIPGMVRLVRSILDIPNSEWRRTLAWRLAWVAVLALHVPLMLRLIERIGEGEAAWHVSFPTLIASMVLFAIEIAFCPMLRLCSDRRRIIALILIIAVVHAGGIDLLPPIDWAEALRSMATILSGIVGLVLALAAFPAPLASDTRRWRLSRDNLRPANNRPRPCSYLQCAPANAPPIG